jgi:hypothetical protein
MLNDFIINIFTPLGFSSLLRIFLLILQVLYVIFSVLVVRQVALLNTSFKTGMSPVFTFIAYAHLILSGLLVLVSLIVL